MNKENREKNKEKKEWTKEENGWRRIEIRIKRRKGEQKKKKMEGEKPSHQITAFNLIAFWPKLPVVICRCQSYVTLRMSDNAVSLI